MSAIRRSLTNRRAEIKTRETGSQIMGVKGGHMQITFLQLAKPKQVVELSKKMDLQEFLNRRQMSMDSRIRVNGKVVSADYQLKNLDIITSVSKSSGGVSS